MCEILADNASTVSTRLRVPLISQFTLPAKATDPHTQLMIYSVLLFYGRRNSAFLRSTKRWQPLFPFLMYHVLLDIDPDIEDTYAGGSAAGGGAVPIPIEVKLRSLCVRVLYEV